MISSIWLWLRLSIWSFMLNWNEDSVINLIELCCNMIFSRFSKNSKFSIFGPILKNDIDNVVISISLFASLFDWKPSLYSSSSFSCRISSFLSLTSFSVNSVRSISSSLLYPLPTSSSSSYSDSSSCSSSYISFTLSSFDGVLRPRLSISKWLTSDLAVDGLDGVEGI